MYDSFITTCEIPVNPEKIYTAWLNSEEHSLFTGSPAKIEPTVGSKFTAWDGYIWGTNLELKPNECIVQAWRTSEFPKDSPDSIVKISFEKTVSGTKIILKHENIPIGQGNEYYQGWQDFYFTPLKKYFSTNW